MAASCVKDPVRGSVERSFGNVSNMSLLPALKTGATDVGT